MTKRVLVSEELAESGLESMRAAGLEVDVALGLTPEELVAAIPGAAALVIRSATQVLMIARSGYMHIAPIAPVKVEARFRGPIGPRGAPFRSSVRAAKPTVLRIL